MVENEVRKFLNIRTIWLQNGGGINLLLISLTITVVLLTKNFSLLCQMILRQRSHVADHNLQTEPNFQRILTLLYRRQLLRQVLGHRWSSVGPNWAMVFLQQNTRIRCILDLGQYREANHCRASLDCSVNANSHSSSRRHLVDDVSYNITSGLQEG